MNRDDIIRMAQEAGIVVTGEAVWRLCELVAAAEREACARVCDLMVMYGPVAEVQQRYNKAYADCRDAIRARSKA